MDFEIYYDNEGYKYNSFYGPIDHVRRGTKDAMRAAYEFRNNEIAEKDALIKKLNDRISDLSWRMSPDKMGGAFTDEEVGRYYDYW